MKNNFKPKRLIKRFKQRKVHNLFRNACSVFVLVQILLPQTACGKPKVSTVDNPEVKEKITITIHPDDEKQTIHSFGASDCWAAKFVGKWADIQKKNHIADLLFSLDTLSDGSPKGIGLSLWRFNIGSGSYEQGAASNITDEWRREECFLNEDGSYNWQKQQGQQWFLQAAKQRGVKYTLGFSLTPPVFMAQNGKAYNSSGTTKLNIQNGKLEAYADFMVQVIKHFGFDFLSPINEPQWTWGRVDGASQEGTQAENTEITSLVKLLSPKLAGTNAKVVIGEAGQWDFLYGRNTDGRGDQINQFFSPYSSNYIGNLPNVASIISSHSYFTTCPDNNMINVRNLVAAQVERVKPGLETWQTEFGILGNICDQYSGSPRNTGINYGIYVAKVLHHDLTIANVTSWQWWLAMSPYNYSDALVYINAPSGQIDIPGSKNDGMVSDSKQLWAFGNFARFVRPGMKRVAVSVSGISTPEEAAGRLMVSAYKDPAAKQVVFVIINPQSIQKTVQLAGISGNLKAYITDNTRNLKKSVVKAENITLSPRSVVTLIGSY
ncbi:hypothetical protein FW774_13125 [Pedobacter sp. BS3]|uniref:glycoside hydrolase n=1 Tax=Pedobacter sp. BS3 TaxID=2567937 RepID=UPI0011EDF2F5|nr:glycoside hydrolase [Pedobacter sp. BS3]TZF83227.1 hypothetical protein FW774_13125 [Pedobacter sp. BS3]